MKLTFEIFYHHLQPARWEEIKISNLSQQELEIQKEQYEVQST